MKYRVLDVLVCPACQNELHLAVFQTIEKPVTDSITLPPCRRNCAFTEIKDIKMAEACTQCYGVEIMSGLLTCCCGEWYPIIGGVPRMLIGELKNTLAQSYPAFFRTYREVLSGGTLSITSGAINVPEVGVKKRTMYSFAYEWRTFSEYDYDNFDQWLRGVPSPSFFVGKVGLETGCGAGRHTCRAVTYGAEIFAVDLSEAVDVAYEKTKALPMAHIIQADIYALPFKREYFDFAYCLGVLQHLPDPSAGFTAIVPFLRAGAMLFVNVYSNERRVLHFFLDGARHVTTRLPNIATRALAFAAALIDYGLLIGLYKVLTRNSMVRQVLEPLMWSRIRAYAEGSFLECYADWFDRLACPVIIRYGRDDVAGWYADNGLRQVQIASLNRAFWLASGVRSGLTT